jgi:phage terminase large subunit-like protein
MTGLAALFARPERGVLYEDFRAGWERRWQEKTFSGVSPNRCRIVKEDENRVLRIESDRSVSGLWREISLDPVRAGKITWRWKVDRSLSGRTDERTKGGDDYAARVFVAFESRFLKWKTRTLCYVWAGKEPAGQVYPSPYSDAVAMIVLQSGEKNTGRWRIEERDFVRDYQDYFGEPPKKVSAVAVMVDTDNTLTRATAWFDDLAIQSE